MTYANEMMEAVLQALLGLEVELPQEQIEALAHDLPREYIGAIEDRAEAGWAEYQSGDISNATYRQQMRDAGRGHLLP